MSNLRNILKQWQSAFLISQVVDQERQIIKRTVAHQLYHGENSEYNADVWPHGFKNFVTNSGAMENPNIAKVISDFLFFIGTSITPEILLKHLELNKRNKSKLIKKVNQIFKTIAHQQENRSVYYLFEECDGEWFYLLNLEDNKGASSVQLDMYEELDLPKLYNLPIDLPLSYENDPLIKNMFDDIENSKSNFFITGKAGTGKSTFIHYFCSKSKERMTAKGKNENLVKNNIKNKMLHTVCAVVKRGTLYIENYIPQWSNRVA